MLCLQVRSLKNLNLNIRRAKIRPGETGKKHKFYVTDSHSAEKITKSARLEEIRMSILQNLLYYHPESASELGFGPKARKADQGDPLHPLGPKKRCLLRHHSFRAFHTIFRCVFEKICAFGA